MAIIADGQEKKGGTFEVMSHMAASLYGHDIHAIYISSEKFLPRYLRKWEHVFRIWYLHKVSKIDFSDFDLIISMQPDAHCIKHTNHIVYFQHHLKQYYDLYWQTFRSKKGIRKKIIFLLLAMIARLADSIYLTPNLRNAHVIVNSETVGKRLGRYNGITNFTVINPGCQMIAPQTLTDCMKEKASGLDGNDSAIILSFSRLSLVQKGIDMILDAAPLLPSYHFIIAGPSDPSIHSIDLLSLPANVQIIEKEFSEDEKADLFCNCRVFLAPYIEEDFGITPIEANAYGKPVVYCDDSGELVRTQKHTKTGFMCNRKSEDIAAAIEFCVRNASILSPTCTDNAANYSWDSFEKSFRAYVEDRMSDSL